MTNKKMIIDLMDAISSDAPISHILEKAQTIASYIGNDTLIKFINCEQTGYSIDSEIPDYRRVNARVEAVFAGKYISPQTVIIPAKLIDYQHFQDLMSSLYMRESLLQLEKMAQDDDDPLMSVKLPATYYPLIESIFEKSEYKVDAAYYRFPKASLLGIISSFKTLLQRLLQQLDAELTWDNEFSSTPNKKKVSSIINNVITPHMVTINDFSTPIANNNNGIEVMNRKLILPFEMVECFFNQLSKKNNL